MNDTDVQETITDFKPKLHKNYKLSSNLIG